MIDNLPVVPDGMLGHFNVLSEVDLPKDATTFHRDLALESGVTRTVRVVDPDGRPLAGARIKFHPCVTNLSEPQRTRRVSGGSPSARRGPAADCVS